VAVTAGNAFVMPEQIPRGWGPLIEPVSCAIHGSDRLAPRIGDHMLIYGAGTIGLILCSLAVDRAAGSVSVVDHNPARLAAATCHALALTRPVVSECPPSEDRATRSLSEAVNVELA
jgi:threonine dehydrogenase-like Zn-dependent dehydrogenase